MKKYDENEGHWRTIGGRRVFIRDGQSLSDAMKASGKFKSAKKKNEYTKEELKKKYGTDDTDIINAGKEEKDRVSVKEDSEEKSKYLEKRNKEAQFERETGKYTGERKTNADGSYKYQTEMQQSGIEKAEAIKQLNKADYEYSLTGGGTEENYKKYQEAVEEAKRVGVYDDWAKRNGYKVEGWKQSNDKKIPRDFSGKKITKEELRQVAKSSEGAWKEIEADNVKRQTEAIEKASGLKVKEAFETDLYGNGKEDRFELNDGRWVSHTKQALGSKQDTWSINELKNGSIESKDFKNYDDMIKHLGGSDKSNEKRIAEKDIKEKGYEYYSRHGLGPNTLPKDVNTGGTGEEENGWTKFKTDRPLTEKELNKYDIQSETKNRQIKIDNNAAYKKAFEEYKKKHPNTKLNLQKFIDMSEGK